MLDALQAEIGVSFQGLELSLLAELRGALSHALVECLRRIDQRILEIRDKSRYETVGFESRTVETVLGESVRFKRRYYYDRETGHYVHLLDAVLGLPGYRQVSPALAQCVLLQGVMTSSYRGAAESLSSLFGKPIVSHETVRNTVMRASEGLGKAEQAWLERTEGKRRVPVLFLEVDGLSVSLQRDRKKRVEERVVTCHEGWEPRYPGSREYRLKHAIQFRTQGEDFWEEASRFIYSLYEIDASTLVVINGDRAPWIRGGVEYFENALYQVDRFHLARDLRRLFNKDPETLKRLYHALESPDVTGATFLAALAQATTILRGTRRREAESMLNDLSEIAEATVDYRHRMRARGLSVEGLRGLGAAESQMDRLSDRVKGRGRSWSREGLAAMMRLLCWRNNGLLESVAHKAGVLLASVGLSPADMERAAREAATKVLEQVPTPRQATAPATRLGRNRTGGMSRVLNSIISSAAPVWN